MSAAASGCPSKEIKLGNDEHRTRSWIDSESLPSMSIFTYKARGYSFRRSEKRMVETVIGDATAPFLVAMSLLNELYTEGSDTHQVRSPSWPEIPTFWIVNRPSATSAGQRFSAAAQSCGFASTATTSGPLAREYAVSS